MHQDGGIIIILESLAGYGYRSLSPESKRGSKGNQTRRNNSRENTRVCKSFSSLCRHVEVGDLSQYQISVLSLKRLSFLGNGLVVDLAMRITSKSTTDCNVLKNAMP